MSLLTFEEGTRCKEECMQKNDDEEIAKNVSSERKKIKLEEAKEIKGELFCSGSEEDSDLEKAKNASSERKKIKLEQPKEIKQELFCSSSEEDSDLEETKNASSKPEKFVKEEKMKNNAQMHSASKEDSNLSKMKTGASNVQCHIKREDIELKKCSVLLDDIRSNQNSKNNNKLSHGKFVKQRAFVDDKQKESSSSDEYEEESIKSDSSSIKSLDSENEAKKKLNKLRSNKKNKYDYSDNCRPHKKMRGESNIFVCSDSDDEVKIVKKKEEKKKKEKKKEEEEKKRKEEEKKRKKEEEKKRKKEEEKKRKEEEEKKRMEEEDYMKKVDLSLYPLFLLREKTAELKKIERENRIRRMKERKEQEPVEINIAQLRQRKQVKYYQSSSSESEDQIVEKGKNDADSEYDDTDSNFDSNEEPSQKEAKGSQKEEKNSSKDTKTTGKSDADSEYDDTDSNFDSHDSNEETSQKKAKGSQKEEKNSSKDRKTTMTDYEKMLLDKKNKNLELLKSIGILEAKSDFFDAVSGNRKQGRPRKGKSEKPVQPAIKRVSKRKKTHIDYTEENQRIFYKSLKQKYNPSSIDFKKALHINNSYENFVEDFSEILEENEDCNDKKPVLYDKNVLQKLYCVEHTTSRNAYRLMSWYPSAETLFITFGGFSDGSLNFWNIDESDRKFYTFTAHSRSVTCLQFNPSVPSQLVSSSRDGTLVIGDMKKQTFTKVLDISREISSFDFFSPHTYLVSLKTGEIVIVDGRKQNEGKHKSHMCHECVINTVNVHPVMKNYFVTAGREGNVNMWDLRKLTDEPVFQIKSHSKEVYSAFFSPIVGKSLLTTSFDETIRIFDVSSKTNKDLNTPKILKYLYKNVKGKRRAMWLPNSDDTFSFGLQKLQIYDKDLNIYATVQDGIKSFRVGHAFHPFIKTLASVTDQTVYISTVPTYLTH